MTERTIHGDYRVIGYDENGNEILRTHVADTGTVTIPDLASRVEHGLDKLRIIPEAMEVRNGGETEVRVETNPEAIDDR